MLDIDDSGGLSFRELELGLRKLKVFAVTPLPGHLVFLSISSVAVHIVTRTFDNHDQVNPPIRISEDDWDTMTPEAADGTAPSSLASPRNSLPHFEEWEREKVEDREGKTENAPKTAGGRNRNRTSVGACDHVVI